MNKPKNGVHNLKVAPTKCSDCKYNTQKLHNYHCMLLALVECTCFPDNVCLVGMLYGYPTLGGSDYCPKEGTFP